MSRVNLTGKFYLCEDHRDIRPDIQDECVSVADWPETEGNPKDCAVEGCGKGGRRVLKIFVDSENV